VTHFRLAPAGIEDGPVPHRKVGLAAAPMQSSMAQFMRRFREQERDARHCFEEMDE